MTHQNLKPKRLLPVVLAAAASLGVCDSALAQNGPAGTDQLVQWTTESGGNGHWYRYVPTISIFTSFSFEFARNAALSSSHLGLSGYLATVTSADEQNFINRSFAFSLGFGFAGNAWLGASDAGVEGQWRWLDGPEAGQLLTYTIWRPNQPSNDFPDYDLLAMTIVATSPPTTYGWVAQSPSNGALGYIVEYGNSSTAPIPEPSTAAMLAAGLAAMGWAARRRRAG